MSNYNLWVYIYTSETYSAPIQTSQMGLSAGAERGLPPARLEKVQFALNVKHALFGAML